MMQNLGGSASREHCMNGSGILDIRDVTDFYDMKLNFLAASSSPVTGLVAKMPAFYHLPRETQ